MRNVLVLLAGLLLLTACETEDNYNSYGGGPGNGGYGSYGGNSGNYYGNDDRYGVYTLANGALNGTGRTLSISRGGGSATSTGTFNLTDIEVTGSTISLSTDAGAFLGGVTLETVSSNFANGSVRFRHAHVEQR